DRLRRLGADLQPILRALLVDLDLLTVVGNEGVVVADTFDIRPSPGPLRVDDADSIEGSVEFAHALQAQLDRHETRSPASARRHLAAAGTLLGALKDSRGTRRAPRRREAPPGREK